MKLSPPCNNESTAEGLNSDQVIYRIKNKYQKVKIIVECMDKFYFHIPLSYDTPYITSKQVMMEWNSDIDTDTGTLGRF